MFYFYYLYVRMLYIPFGIFQMNHVDDFDGLPTTWMATSHESIVFYASLFFLLFGILEWISVSISICIFQFLFL